MPYSQKVAIDFWFEFDNVFKNDPPEEILNAYGQLGNIDRPRLSWSAHRKNGTYPDGYRDDMKAIQAPLLFLSGKQVEVMDKYFQGDPEMERRSFEDFGQGILFDDRREPTQKLHMMDTSGPANPPIGYHRWHPFIRAAVLLGADAGRWLTINRNVALAWAIQSFLKPVQDKKDNPPLTDEQMQAFRGKYMQMNEAALDSGFDSFPYPAG